MGWGHDPVFGPFDNSETAAVKGGGHPPLHYFLFVPTPPGIAQTSPLFSILLIVVDDHHLHSLFFFLPLQISRQAPVCQRDLSSWSA